MPKLGGSTLHVILSYILNILQVAKDTSFVLYFREAVQAGEAAVTSGDGKDIATLKNVT